jgi:glycine cleavage system transcriptional repressor
MPGRDYLLLSATEPDRSGLVAELTGFIAECGGNVEDSRVVVLGGHAGLMLLVSGPADRLAAVVSGLEALQQRTGIRAVPRRVAPRRDAGSHDTGRVEISASAIDHEGIIHALAETVRRHGGNILELESATEPAPMSGEPLLTLRMTVWAGEAGAGERLRQELEQVAEREGVDLGVRLVPPSKASAAVGSERRTVPRPPSDS